MTDAPAVVITGLGCVSPFGRGLDVFWKGLFTGREPLAPTGFSAAGMRVAGVLEVPDQDGPPEERPVHLLTTSARDAVEQAALRGPRLRRSGLVLASTSAGWHLPGQAFGSEPLTCDEGLLRKEWPAVALVEELGLTGPCAVLSSACASSTGALAWATERIRAGEAEVMLVAAVDVVTEVVLAGFRSMRLLTRSSAARPFAVDRDGFVLAEGSVVAVLESAGHAARRGALPRAVLAGWGASSDAGHLTTPAAEGIARSMRAALTDADCRPEDVGILHAHATASAANDLAEARAVAQVFGPGPPGMLTTAVKGAIGHTEGAAGLFTFAAAVEGLVRDHVPPVLSGGVQDPATVAVRLPSAHQPYPAGSALVHASGFGGANCTVVVNQRPARHKTPDPVPIQVVAAGLAYPEGAATLGWHPAFDRAATPLAGSPPVTPPPDRVCRLLTDAVGAVLGGLAEEQREHCLAGGLLMGTEFGSQHHHARMYAALRTRGVRGVEPLDFALSTFNTPAAMTSVVHGITGRTETYLGASGSVEALVSGVQSVASGQVSAILVGGCEAPENRLRVPPGSAPLSAAATVLALAPADAVLPTGATAVEVAGFSRLPIAARPASVVALDHALDGLCGRRRPAVLLASGCPGSGRDTAASSWVLTGPVVGAVASLDAHLAAIGKIADGDAEEAVVAVTGPYCSTILVHYRALTGWPS
ncbi:beta-ketoacyl synthase N-terminal-like domain-containing protein [Streptomyces xylophagus]|uniref:beta-ketoacyl synthase N-terminal-like domain-containing protein n=1 Tax=Streptomyces xylophagus TaxID=285514 RepID=UPI00069008EA|nr:beta-ketoacyl synthase N-terminal-like domain-containing protein [Streptomyces xylophagus]